VPVFTDHLDVLIDDQTALSSSPLDSPIEMPVSGHFDRNIVVQAFDRLRVLRYCASPR